MLELIICIVLFIILAILVVMNMNSLGKLKEDVEKKDKVSIDIIKDIKKDIDNIKYYLNNTRAVSNSNDKLLGEAVTRNKNDIDKLKK